MTLDALPQPGPTTTDRVLIVDDDEMALALLEQVLTVAGYRVHTASSGEQAIAVLRDHECQIVICDWEMPGMCGPDLCRTVRARANDRYVYFILLAANQSSQHRLDGYSAGADDYVAKPFDAAELLSRLRVASRVVARDSADVTIFAMAKLAESRDHETGGHLERVQRYCRVLALAAWQKGLFPNELDAEFVRLIYETSPLHDIGKVAIPDAVLLKPGRLSDEEFKIMKAHTLMGAQTLSAALALRPNARYLRLARDIALSHHERWDGTGYPHGISGTNIPLAARIVALADVYDALSSKRVYKPAFTSVAVRAIILEGKGTHFDPSLVDLFQELEPEFVRISEEFAEAAFTNETEASPTDEVGPHRKAA